MQDIKFIRISGIVGSVLFAVLLSCLLYYSATKPLYVVKAEEDGVENVDTVSESAVLLTQVFPAGDLTYDNFVIPLGSTVSRDDIRIENSYMNRRLTVIVENYGDGSNVAKKMIGRLDGILAVQTGLNGSDLLIVFTLDGIYEYEMVLENGNLGLKLMKPAEVYEHVLVLDAGHGGEDAGNISGGDTESAVTLAVARLVKEKLEENGIRVYMTRTLEKEIAPEERVKLVKDSGADMYISLHLNDTDEPGISAYYNDQFFLTRLTGAELSDYLVRNTTMAVTGRGNGIFALDDESEILGDLSVTGSLLTLGSLSHFSEGVLLTQDKYQHDLAEGISRGILEAYENSTL